jgi:phage terminase small subunit
MKTSGKGNKAAVSAPSHLHPETRAWVESVLSEYVLEEHHRRLLVLAGEAWDRNVQARQAIDKHGMVFTDRFGGEKTRPEVAIERDMKTVFARLVRELQLDVEAPPETSRRPPMLRGRAGLRVAT